MATSNAKVLELLAKAKARINPSMDSGVVTTSNSLEIDSLDSFELEVVTNKAAPTYSDRPSIRTQETKELWLHYITYRIMHPKSNIGDMGYFLWEMIQRGYDTSYIQYNNDNCVNPELMFILAFIHGNSFRSFTRVLYFGVDNLTHEDQVRVIDLISKHYPEEYNYAISKLREC